jgi:GntR family transcriptional repressor for pyruvate dehydrogenase complex
MLMLVRRPGEDARGAMSTLESVPGRQMTTYDIRHGMERRWIPLQSAPSIVDSRGYDEDSDMAGLALHAGLVLSYNHVSLADVYVASASVLPPSLVRLAHQEERTSCSGLRAVVAAERGHSPGLAGLLRTELAFQDAIVDALGCETLVVLMDMLHEIIDAAMSHLDRRFTPAARHLAEVRTHHEIVRLVEAGHGQAAASLARVRTREIEDFIREYDARPLVSG